MNERIKVSKELTDRLTPYGCKYEYTFMSDDTVVCFYSKGCEYQRYDRERRLPYCTYLEQSRANL